MLVYSGEHNHISNWGYLRWLISFMSWILSNYSWFTHSSNPALSVALLKGFISSFTMLRNAGCINLAIYGFSIMIMAGIMNPSDVYHFWSSRKAQEPRFFRLPAIAWNCRPCRAAYPSRFKRAFFSRLCFRSNVKSCVERQSVSVLT